MEKVKVPIHKHPLLPLTRFSLDMCKGCSKSFGYISGYRCNEFGCEKYVFHKECAELLLEINHSSHPDHPLKLLLINDRSSHCSRCGDWVFLWLLLHYDRSSHFVYNESLLGFLFSPEEPEEPPFVVIDDNTIKHFSHDHNLRINKDGRILHESTLCQACVFQICSEPFYSCEQCDFILHKQCANLPRKKRHVSHNQQLTLDTNSQGKTYQCHLCRQHFTGFWYESLRGRLILDVRCSSISEPFVHECHPHPLYYSGGDYKYCTACGYSGDTGCFSCDECDFRLDFKCAILPHKVMRHRYDDHPLFLSYGEISVNGEYWCEACETKVNPRKWFYTCKNCGVTLHISCVVGDLSYMIPGSVEVVPNSSICRPICTGCNSRCKLPSIFQVSMAEYVCSFECRIKYHSLTKLSKNNTAAIID